MTLDWTGLMQISCDYYETKELLTMLLLRILEIFHSSVEVVSHLR